MVAYQAVRPARLEVLEHGRLALGAEIASVRVEPGKALCFPRQPVTRPRLQRLRSLRSIRVRELLQRGSHSSNLGVGGSNPSERAST
jgi:hypothetical protein